jgi:Nucleotidyl transferase AbiEii toxin, Type IV TA system
LTKCSRSTNHEATTQLFLWGCISRCAARQRIARDESLDLQRVRRQAAFDRLLCRLFVNPDAPWLHKGGYAMELRLKTARTTRDIDLALKRLPVPSADWDANAATVLEALREAGQVNLLDFFHLCFWRCDTAPGCRTARDFQWTRAWGGELS